MTEYWVSTEKHYCSICKCWICGSKQNVLNHEKSLRHTGNLTRHLRDARDRTERERKDREFNAREVARIQMEAGKAVYAPAPSAGSALPSTAVAALARASSGSLLIGPSLPLTMKSISGSQTVTSGNVHSAAVMPAPTNEGDSMRQYEGAKEETDGKLLPETVNVATLANDMAATSRTLNGAAVSAAARLYSNDELQSRHRSLNNVEKAADEIPCNTGSGAYQTSLVRLEALRYLGVAKPPPVDLDKLAEERVVPPAPAAPSLVAPLQYGATLAGPPPAVSVISAISPLSSNCNLPSVFPGNACSQLQICPEVTANAMAHGATAGIAVNSTNGTCVADNEQVACHGGSQLDDLPPSAPGLGAWEVVSTSEAVDSGDSKMSGWRISSRPSRRQAGVDESRFSHLREETQRAQSGNPFPPNGLYEQPKSARASFTCDDADGNEDDEVNDDSWEPAAQRAQQLEKKLFVNKPSDRTARSELSNGEGVVTFARRVKRVKAHTKSVLE